MSGHMSVVGSSEWMCRVEGEGEGGIVFYSHDNSRSGCVRVKPDSRSVFNHEKFVRGKPISDNDYVRALLRRMELKRPIVRRVNDDGVNPTEQHFGPRCHVRYVQLIPARAPRVAHEAPRTNTKAASSPPAPERAV